MIKMQPVMTVQMKINHFHYLLRKGGTADYPGNKYHQPSNNRGRAGRIPTQIRKTGFPSDGKA